MRGPLILGIFALLACGGGSRTTMPTRDAGVVIEHIKLELQDLGCGQFDQIRAVSVTIDGATHQASGCKALREQTLGAMQAALAAQVTFDELDAGDFTVTLLGFEDPDCRVDKLALCGRVTLHLPPPSSTLMLPLTCSIGSMAAAFASCAQGG